MFFFIGGVEDKPTLIDEGPYRCPSCGADSAVVYRLDRYITFFFIPIFPISRGRTLLRCKRCGYAEDERTAQLRGSGSVGTGPAGGASAARGGSAGGSGARGERRCLHCGEPVSADFRYCPYCGADQRT